MASENGPIDALIFDFDGLILDTEGPDYWSWAEVFEAHGAELTLNVWAAAVGHPSGAFDVVAHLEELSGRAIDRHGVRETRRVRYHAMVHEQQPLGGVLDYIREAEARGLALGVGSSADRAWVHGHLERLGIARHFRVVRCLEDIKEPKPAPEVFLRVADELGAAPARTVVLEDSPPGVRAAKAAGMWCLAVPNAITRQYDTSLADFSAASLTGFPLSELLAAIASRA